MVRQAVRYVRLVGAGTATQGQPCSLVALLDGDGEPVDPADALVPAATVDAPGTVRQAAAVPDASAAPTQADFNGLLASLRAAGILAEA